MAVPCSAGIRITTNRRSIDPPLSVVEALDFVREWLEKPTVHIISPGDGHPPILVELEATGAPEDSGRRL